MIKWKKKSNLSDLSPKQFQKVLIKIDEMADVSLKSAEQAKNTLLTLAPPSSYTLNLKTLTQVSKDSWSSQLSWNTVFLSEGFWAGPAMNLKENWLETNKNTAD